MNILTPAPNLGSTLLTLLNQQRSIAEFARSNGLDHEWLCTLHADLLRGHQPTITQEELERLIKALIKPGQIYRHRKHDPTGGKWHEYEVEYIVSPTERTPSPVTTNFPLGACIHTETQKEHALIGCRDKVYASPKLWVPHVAYRSTKEDDDKIWLRPLSMFTDGRFTLIS